MLISATKLLASLLKFFHVSDYMEEILHWLPVEQRIKFKILFLGAAMLVVSAPASVSVLRSPVNRCALLLVDICKSCTATEVYRCISMCWTFLLVCLPWNSLSIAIDSPHNTFSFCFRTHLCIACESYLKFCICAVS